MANRLASQTSPYLLQHANNPVDWYPWGEEALELAVKEDRPILLSVGYSACHWCHVMEHESFSDADIAAVMNRDFVCIKVDREERPDIDSVYMSAVQAMTGSGGWPLTAFLTPKGVPFFGGTYFPPEPRHRLPSFPQVLDAAIKAYRDRRDAVDQAGEELLRVLRGTQAAPDIPIPVAEGAEALLGQAVEFAGQTYDATNGGFGSAPKFPQPVVLDFLLRQGNEHSHPVGMAVNTLRRMAQGGLRDHLEGGFHRYSVDAVWLVPHFEKMLYDNALLARAYVVAHQITGEADLREVGEQTIDYVLADLRSPLGAFYSARDADSEGEEGTYYVWTPEEVDTVLERDTSLGPDSVELFKHCYDISASGNFEGKNILHLPHNLDALARSAGISVDELRGILRTGRGALQAQRSQRIAPFRDEKVLVSWNGMMIRTLAESGAALGRQDYVQAGVRAAKAMIKATLTDSGLMRVWTGDHVHVPAFLEDYASLGNACLSLYEATLDPAWLEQAKTLAEQVVEGFWDGVQFYDADSNHGELVIRPRDIMDNATPSGNSLAVELLLRVSAVTGTEYGAEVAKKALAGEALSLRRYPTAVSRLLVACGWLVGPPVEVVLVGSGQDTQQQLDAIHRVFAPVRVIAGGDPEDPRVAGLPLMKGRTEPTGRVYVCRGATCLAPATSLSEVQDRLIEAKST